MNALSGLWEVPLMNRLFSILNKIKLKKCWIESLRWRWSTASVCNVKRAPDSQGRGCRWCHVCDAFECQMCQLHLKSIKPKIWAVESAYHLCQAKSSVKVAAGRKTDNTQRWSAFHLCFWTRCFSTSLIFCSLFLVLFLFFSPLPQKSSTDSHMVTVDTKKTQIKSTSELAVLMPLLSCCNAPSRVFCKRHGCHFLLCPSIRERKWFPGVAETFAIQLWEQSPCYAILVGFKKLRLLRARVSGQAITISAPTHPVLGQTMSSLLGLGEGVGTAGAKLPFLKRNLALFPSQLHILWPSWGLVAIKSNIPTLCVS